MGNFSVWNAFNILMKQLNVNGAIQGLQEILVKILILMVVSFVKVI